MFAVGRASMVGSELWQASIKAARVTSTILASSRSVLMEFRSSTKCILHDVAKKCPLKILCSFLGSR